jgi:hypothetical protein
VRELKLATSRYSNAELIRSSGLGAVRISIGHPRWKLSYPLVGICRDLMPTRPMLKLEIEPYRAMYLDRLEAVGVEAIVKELETIQREHAPQGLVLLCFEDLTKPGEWCHRTMFARWFEEKTGNEVPELVTAEAPLPNTTALSCIPFAPRQIGELDA